MFRTGELQSLKRKNVKKESCFLSDSRSGKIFRECDRIYDQLFGSAAFSATADGGCIRFDTYVGGSGPGDSVGGIHEKGVYCTCSGNLCNGGTIDEDSMNITQVGAVLSG